MFSLFNKRNLAIVSALLLNAVTNLSAWECCEPPECNRLYIGAFGGGICSNSSKVSQLGTALLTEAEGGPLAVSAKGRTRKAHTGFGGVQLGYEWFNHSYTPYSDWTITPAVEMEAYWFSQTKKGHLANTTDLDRLPEHDFFNKFHIDQGVYLANAVFSLNNCYGLTPYVGGGVGATRIAINRASSIQLDPFEPGINHFNSGRKDSSWAFAAQVKAGLRYTICKSFHVFGEYRYLFVDSSNYIFGSTVYPTHARTTPWNVKIKDIQYNSFVFGLQYDL